MVTSKRKVAGAVLLMLAAFVCLFVLTCTVLGSKSVAYAAEAETEQTEQLPETLGTRVERWCSEKFVEILSTVNFGSIVGCIITLIVDSKKNKKNKEEINRKVQANTTSNGEVVQVVNTLVADYNKVTAKLDTIAEENFNLKNALAQQAVISRSVLEILYTVYQNNKNLPQGVKDLVSLLYVNARKIADVHIEDAEAEVETDEGE